MRIATFDGPADVTLPTIEQLESVSGEAGELLGDARIRFDRLEEALDRGQNREIVATHPRPVRAHYVVDDNHVAVATDFDTLVMFSSYAHLESAALFFRGLDVPIAHTSVPVYYAPVVEGGVLPSTDSVAYLTGVDFFVVESSGDLPGLPIGANPGIVAHEYSHRIWYYELWTGALLERLPAILEDETQAARYNLLRAVNEGVADYFGARVTEDPRYIERSFDDVDHRALDSAFVAEAAWLDGREPRIAGRYDPYALGMVLASTLWRLRGDELDAAIISTERQLATEISTPFAYELGDFEVELVRQLVSRVDACNAFEESYAVAWDRFAGVCP